MPALSRGRLAADSAICKSNLRQSAIGIATYVADHETYPLGHQYFHFLLGPYLNLPSFDTNAYVPFVAADGLGLPWPGRLSQTVLSCPSFSRLPNPYGFAFAYNWGGVASSDYPDPQRRSQFGLGGEVFARFKQTFGFGTRYGLPTSIRAIKDSEVLNPANMISLGDSVAWSGPLDPPHYESVGFADLSDAIRYDYNTLGSGFPETWQKRHNSKFNSAFCDGHVEVFPARKFFDNKNAEYRRRWNNDFQPHLEF